MSNIIVTCVHESSGHSSPQYFSGAAQCNFIGISFFHGHRLSYRDLKRAVSGQNNMLVRSILHIGGINSCAPVLQCPTLNML